MLGFMYVKEEIGQGTGVGVQGLYKQASHPQHPPLRLAWRSGHPVMYQSTSGSFETRARKLVSANDRPKTRLLEASARPLAKVETTSVRFAKTGGEPAAFASRVGHKHTVPARASHLSDWPQACSRQCGRAPLATRSGACSRRASATWRRPTCSRLTRTSPTPPFGRRTIWARGRTVRCSLRRLRRAPPAARGISRGGGQRARLPQPRRQDGHAARVPVAHAYVAHLQAVESHEQKQRHHQPWRPQELSQWQQQQ